MNPIYLLALSWFVALNTAPFAAAETNVPESSASDHVPTIAASHFEFRGESVDGELPATYRLPPVALAPSAIATTTIQPQPIFLPPESNSNPPPLATNVTSPVGVVPAAEPTFDRAFDSYSPVGPLPDETGESHAEFIPPLPTDLPPGVVLTEPATGDIRPAPQEIVQTAAVTSALAEQMLPAVQRGYLLARRGALYAARTEFVQVLRRVAQAKDIETNSDIHSRSLAAGLRALDEADDFVPEGVQLEAELDVKIVASSHRTAVLDGSNERLMPHEAVARYHEFARAQLASAVSGEQAGSMALYGLGRIDARLAERKDDDIRFVRDAMTMYAAALTACPQNHLAANELGVLECRTGRPAEAARLFERTIDLAPTATAYHNLAVAQRKLGLHRHAEANEQESQRLAVLERASGAMSRRAGVQWVPPEELARYSQPGAMTAPPVHTAASEPRDKSPWQRTIEFTRSIALPGSRSADPLGPQQDMRMAQPASEVDGPRWR